MLKFENTAELGDIIRAYDFEPMPDRPDHYVTGRVIHKGPIFVDIEGTERYICDGYTMLCSYDTNGSREGVKVHVPFEMGFTDFDGRVECLTVECLYKDWDKALWSEEALACQQ